MTHTVSAKDRFAENTKCFIAGWFRVGRQCSRSEVLVVNAQRQSDDNLRYLDPGRSAGSKEIFSPNILRSSSISKVHCNRRVRDKRTRETVSEHLKRMS